MHVRTQLFVTFFGLISETQDPENFPKSLAMLQVTDTVLYLVSGLVIYKYAGADVESPAPSSAGPLMKKICYGIAIPTVSPYPFLSSQQHH